MREIEREEGTIERKLVYLDKELGKAMKLFADKKIKSVTYKRIKGRDRNLPCPCGSGKKYKHCCGSPKAGNR